VSSISAPNGVGKSSIYDALNFALRGKIDKLDRLLQAERAQDYYLNRFHPAGVGTVKLNLRPDNGGAAVTLIVTRNAAGQRTLTGHNDAETLLAELNREFVLLDGQTFQSFMYETALNRGHSFSGLLGLHRYSTLRQQLQQLSQTRFPSTRTSIPTHRRPKRLLLTGPLQRREKPSRQITRLLFWRKSLRRRLPQMLGRAVTLP
jgi:hypothetical protein